MYLLDTDTVIYSLKRHGRVLENMESHRDDPKALSVITYGELLYGARKSGREAENLAKVQQIAEIFPIIEVSRAVMETFSILKAKMEAKGSPVDDFDIIIGATALAMNYTVVTNNERHFGRIPGLQVENWTK